MTTLTKRLAPLALLATLATAGCGSSPTAPVARDNLAPAAGAEASSIQRASAEEPAVDPVPMETAATIKGQDGGSLSLGAFTLDIPAGAFKGNATITLRQPDPSLMQVEIDVQPASKNAFAATALLTADLSGWRPAQIRKASLWAWNPATGAFDAVPGATVDVAGRRVRAGFTTLGPSEVRTK